MKRKIKILTIACIVASLALMLTQYFYLTNSYALYQKTLFADIKSDLFLMERQMNIDSLRMIWMKNIELKLHTTDVELKNYILQHTDSALISRNKAYISANKLLADHEVKYITILNEVLIRFDTIPGGVLTLKNIPWFYNDHDLETRQELSNHTLSSTLKGRNNEKVFCEMKTTSYFSVGNLFTPLLNKMMLSIIGTTLILISAIVLFYISIKSIIRQNKIADLKTDFVNTITHEFNTPLAALNVALTALKSKTEISNDPLAKTAISTIDRQYKRLKDLINHTTEHSLGAEQIKLEVERIDNQQFLIDAVNDFINTHPDSMVTLNVEKGKVNLWIDSFHFTTAITNLLDNAAKYGNGSIEIRSFTDGRDYKIWIKDNGAGIPDTKKKFIFEKFTRLEAEHNKVVNGLGLGLYYAKLIIDAHKGNIDTKNHEGQGATFIISIPQA